MDFKFTKVVLGAKQVQTRRIDGQLWQPLLGEVLVARLVAAGIPRGFKVTQVRPSAMAETKARGAGGLL